MHKQQDGPPKTWDKRGGATAHNPATLKFRVLSSLTYLGAQPPG